MEDTCWVYGDAVCLRAGVKQRTSFVDTQASTLLLHAHTAFLALSEPCSHTCPSHVFFLCDQPCNHVWCLPCVREHVVSLVNKKHGAGFLCLHPQCKSEIPERVIKVCETLPTIRCSASLCVMGLPFWYVWWGFPSLFVQWWLPAICLRAGGAGRNVGVCVLSLFPSCLFASASLFFLSRIVFQLVRRHKHSLASSITQYSLPLIQYSVLIVACCPGI